MTDDKVTLRNQLATKTISLPLSTIRKMIEIEGGAAVCMPIVLDWFDIPEPHRIASAVALANGQPDPYPNPNLIVFEIKRDVR